MGEAMTYRVEVGGIAVPESLTAGGTSPEHTASIVAQVSHPGDIITVEEDCDGEIVRRWFKVLPPAPGSLERSVEEIHKTGAHNVVRLVGRDD